MSQGGGERGDRFRRDRRSSGDPLPGPRAPRGLQRFALPPHTRGRGQVGEDAAVRHLRAVGYRIIQRNARTAAGEIDIVAEDRGVLCFVEVKARSSATFGAAVAAVDGRKQRRLARAAALYLARRAPVPCRFDVLGLDLQEGGWRCTLIRDAFRVE